MSVYEANINITTANAEYFTNDMTNDVAFGTTDASQRILIGAHMAQNAGMLIGSSNISFSVRGSTTASTIQWMVNNSTAAMTLQGNGNLGLGTTSPSYKLHVAGGQMYTDNAVGAGTYIYTGLGSVSAPSHTFTGDLDTGMWSVAANTLNFSTGASERIRVDSNGNVAIGTTSASYKLHVSGDIYATADIIAYSDARFKDELQVIEGALSKITQITGYTYKVRDSKTNECDQKRHTGVLAQDVEKVLPEAISKTQEEVLGVAYGNMAGLIIEAIKEVNKKLEALRNDFEMYKTM